MGQEVADTKAGYSRAINHLKSAQPNVVKLREDHSKAVNIGDQFMAHLAAAEKSLLWHLDVVGSMSQGCDRQQQEGKVAQDILSKAGIVEDDTSSDTIYDAVNSVRCVGPYAERYKDVVIRTVLGDLGAVGMLGVLQEMQRMAKSSLEEFMANPPEDVEEIITEAIDDCNKARDSI